MALSGNRAGLNRPPARDRSWRWLIGVLGVVLLASGPAFAHRPYFTTVRGIVLPDGRPGEMRVLMGDGIMLADPGRILVLDDRGRLLARSPISARMTLVCTGDGHSCRGYDGGRTLIPEPSSFRVGGIVPGLSVEERSGLWPFEQGDEHWGFTLRPATFVETMLGEYHLAQDALRALAFQAALGLCAGALVLLRTRHADGRRWSPGPRWAFNFLVRLPVLALILMVSTYAMALIGISPLGWLFSLANGACVALFLWSRRRRTVPAS